VQLATTFLRKKIPLSGRGLHCSIEKVKIVETGMAGQISQKWRTLKLAVPTGIEPVSSRLGRRDVLDINGVRGYG
jgi:hypothetical protein